jgi:hypothetical protein
MRGLAPSESVLVVVTDGRVTVSTLGLCVRPLPKPICCVTRVRGEAALYDSAPAKVPRLVSPACKGSVGSHVARCHFLLDHCDMVTGRGWDGAVAQVIEQLSTAAVWYHSCGSRCRSVGSLGAIHKGRSAPKTYGATIVLSTPYRCWRGTASGGDWT